MNAGAGSSVVIAVGNEFRRDDGVGLAVLARLTGVVSPGVDLRSVDGEPSRLMDAWDGYQRAIVLDAAVTVPARPGRIHHHCVIAAEVTGSTSSHGLGVPEAVELARVLDRLPPRLVLLTVEAADTGFGQGLSPPVAAALPDLVEAVLGELAT